MKEIVVLSGKGGTGKTSFTASFAQLAKYQVALGDCDVDAANLALLMPGDDILEKPFHAGQRARVDYELCNGCGMCEDICRYDAISVSDGLARVNKIACEGCRTCSAICPSEAIDFLQNHAGDLFMRKTQKGLMIHGALGIAQDNSGKLVAEVRKQTRKIAKDKEAQLIILDGPPGIGCPVHAAMGGVDLVVAVTEPSLSGMHDLERMLELSEHFKLRSVVVINKFDLSIKITNEIEAMLQKRGVKMVGKIPFDEQVPRALSAGNAPIVIPGIKKALEKTWAKIENEFGIV